MHLSTRNRCTVSLAVSTVLSIVSPALRAEESPSVSGRYPHLATYNKKGECGTGAVVPWADRLWVITYAPHEPSGSDDKLYEISSDLSRVTRPESVGGTPANRMIHKETNQLNIGPYFIDEKRNVRVITPSKMPGRLTATARHLTDPENRLYVLDMEGMLYDVDAHTLDVKKLFARMAPGAHCKGGYTAQGRLVMSNNGNIVANKATPAADSTEYKKDPEAAGVLAEWDGKTWTIDENRQFTDITSAGGIYGAPSKDSPLWALGWDKRSVMLKLLDGGKWQTFRLPVADYSYVAKHGWYTEWPRIREVGDGKFLMNMHGAWFDFPKTFSASNTAGIRPLGTYLKITGDFCQWGNRLVFGCDDASLLRNPLLGQSQSNLWFTTWDDLSQHGAPVGDGGPWMHDAVKADEPSVPYLAGGYTQRLVHLANGSNRDVTFYLEADAQGKGEWHAIDIVEVPARGYKEYLISDEIKAEWVRLKTDLDCDDTTAYFHYGVGGGSALTQDIAALPDATGKAPVIEQTVRPLAADPGTLWIGTKDGKPYEVTADLKVQPYTGKEIITPAKGIGEADGYKVTQDARSVIITDATGRYRLPRYVYDEPARPIREVVTERLMLNAGGSFFVLPYPTAGGARRLKPICTHGKRIADFCSWRGLMVLAGTLPDAKPDGHVFAAGNGGPSVWLGDIDDLWRMGRPRGEGAVWEATEVKAGEVSDPFLMAGYQPKSVMLSHDSTKPVKITLEVDFAADGTWHEYRSFDILPGQTASYDFPVGYSAHWIRTKIDTACKATAEFEYQ